MKLNITENKEVEARFIQVFAGVRYWDDAEINGERSEYGENVPFKIDGFWKPLIDIESGQIIGWPNGMNASFHFKVCDAGSYYLLDKDMNVLSSIENNYVPSGLCHGDNGYGDYIIFSVDGDGSILNYSNDIDSEDWS